MLYPRTVELGFATVPSGLALALGGDTATAPFSHTVIVGSSNSIAALTPQAQGQALYEFAAWSDGGALAHLVEAPSAPATWTALFAAAPACRDGFDNDGDAQVDGSDPGCADPDDVSEHGAELACDDGEDNDGDGVVDLTDPGCESATDASETDASVACDDTLDNDGDGRIDLADRGCTNPADTNEYAPDEDGTPPQIPALPPLGVLLVATALVAAARLPISSSGSRCPRSFTRIK
jgi:hypothetical protein